MSLAIMKRDAFAQNAQPEGVGIADRLPAQRRDGRLAHPARRRRAGLADLHMDDPRPGLLQQARLALDVHGDERRHRRPKRGSDDRGIHDFRELSHEIF